MENRDELAAIVRDIYSETYGIWQEVRPQLTTEHDHGFKIIYTPLRFEPKVLIIGLQPGGDASHIKDAELRQPSAVNEYLNESWILASELRKRLGEDYLEDCVGTNAVFFRAPDWQKWRRINPALRDRIEQFCVSQNKRLISAIKPNLILLLGWDTLKLMGNQTFREQIANKPVIGAPRKRRKRLLQSGNIEGIPAFAIPHPSAAWKYPTVTDEDWLMIAAGLRAPARS